MYPHRTTGEYRLLLQQILTDEIGCSIFALGSDQQPRYIGGLGVAPSSYLLTPALAHYNLHWFPLLLYHNDSQQSQTRGKTVTVFDTKSESFRLMRAPVLPTNTTKSYVFEMDSTLGIYSSSNDLQIVDIWMLRERDYQSEVWNYKYRVKLSVVEVKERFGGCLNDIWCIKVHSVDGYVVLLANGVRWMFHVDTDGKLVDSFRHDGQHVSASQLRLKQTLVPHTFFTALQDYDVNASPFV